jgi:hypothetical protein
MRRVAILLECFMSHKATRSLGSLGGAPVGLTVSYAFPLIAGAVLGMSLVHLAVRPQWSDQTWLLFAAGRMLDGGRIGFEDVAEENPPLIIWLSAIPVAIGRALDIPLPAALQGWVTALVAFSVIWSAILLRRETAADSKRFAGWFALAQLFATAVHPWLHYGQREHIMLLLVLPYLVMAAGRIEGQAPPTGEAVVAGLCAGIGSLLKPHQLLVLLAVEGLLLVRSRRFRSVYRPEMAAMVATGLGYVGAIWLWTPDYLLKLLPLAFNTYYDYHRAELSELISPMRGLKLVLVVLLWAILYRRLAHRALATVLLLAGIGATVAHVMQLKGFGYQFVPAIAFFDLLFGVIVIDCWLQWVARRTPPISTGLAAATATLMFAGTIALYYPQQLARAASSAPDDRNVVQRAVSHDIPRDATVLILSTSPEAVFEQVLDRNWQWASRFMSLWMVPAIVKAERAASRDGTVEPAAMRDAAVLTRIAVSADLTRWQPNPVLVERCQDATAAHCRGIGTIRLDLLQWLEQDAGFAAAWSHYVREGPIGPYDLWCRKGQSDVCRRILANSHHLGPVDVE